MLLHNIRPICSLNLFYSLYHSVTFFFLFIIFNNYSFLFSLFNFLTIMFDHSHYFNSISIIPFLLIYYSYSKLLFCYFLNFILIFFFNHFVLKFL